MSSARRSKVGHAAVKRLDLTKSAPGVGGVVDELPRLGGPCLINSNFEKLGLAAADQFWSRSARASPASSSGGVSKATLCFIPLG